MDPADPMAVTLAGREAIERRKNLRSAARAVGEQFTDEERRYLIRACLRELEEPNAATTALECLEAAADEIEATGTDQAMNSNSTGWRDQLVKDIRYAAGEVRSLLPETEGEA